MVRIPSGELHRVSQYQKYVNEYLKCYGEKPPKECLCMQLEISERALENLEKIVYAYNSIQSLDEPLGEDAEISRHEAIAGSDNVENEVVEKCTPDIWDIIEEYLPKNEFEVVCMRYHGNLTLENVGKQIGKSRERVRQLEARGLKHLREPITSRAIMKRYDVVANYYHIVTTNSPISQMGMTRRENAERRRRRILANSV